MKGELRPSKNRTYDGLRHLVPTFLRMDDFATELYFVFLCGQSRDSNGYYYVTALWVPYHVHTINTSCVKAGGSEELGAPMPYC